jgi:hypothetical protein
MTSFFFSSVTLALIEKPFGETIVPHQSPVEAIFGRGATPMSSPALRYPAQDQSPLMIIPAFPSLKRISAIS